MHVLTNKDEDENISKFYLPIFSQFDIQNICLEV